MASRKVCFDHKITYVTSEGCPECFFQETRKQRAYHGTREAKKPVEDLDSSTIELPIDRPATPPQVRNLQSGGSPLHTRKMPLPMNPPLASFEKSGDWRSETGEKPVENVLQDGKIFVGRVDLPEPSNPNPMFQGYRELNDIEIERIAQIKDAAQVVRVLCKKMADASTAIEGDDHCTPDLRWIAIAETHLQQGFMALTRAIARPTSF